MTPLLQREADFAERREIDPHPRIALICFKVLLFLAYSCVSPGSALGTGTVNLAIAMSTACPSLEQRGREGEERKRKGDGTMYAISLGGQASSCTHTRGRFFRQMFQM